MPTGTMAGTAARNKEPGRGRSAEMNVAVGPVLRGRVAGLTSLDKEMSEHLGRAKHGKTRDGRAGNARNGTILFADVVRPVRIAVPHGRDVSCRSGHREKVPTQTLRCGRGGAPPYVKRVVDRADERGSGGSLDRVRGRVHRCDRGQCT
jgi:hypothetical protein